MRYTESMRLLATVALLAGFVFAAPAAAFTPSSPWPPTTGPGVLFVHYGEEHWNDDDGLTLLPKIVEDAARYKPKLVTMSGDKDNDGNTEELTKWREIMEAYDKAGVPYFAAVGNHDRDAPPGGVPGVPPPGSLEPYREVFKDRPYPMGDAAQYEDLKLSPRERPAGDPAGAASHYFVDYGDVRWIFIDNSCWQITGCDIFQLPTAQTKPDEGQFDFLERVAKEGTDAGKVVFVVMHMPTQDVTDQSYRDPIARMHTMGKGTSPDNATFESVAAATGVDGVFLGHIKGQFVYEGEGGIPYYIDGGAGGELYTEGPIGTDHGYWHGFRLLRVDGKRIVTDSVPIFVKDGIRIEGPASMDRGEGVVYEAFGKQPVFKDPAKVEALELRDPDPQTEGGGASAWTYLLWLLPVGGALLLLVVATRVELPRRVRLAAVPAGLIVLASFGAVAGAQKSEPTTTKKENLPIPARIWTTSNPNVLMPVASADDDPRRDRKTQTDGGQFRGICPGRATVQITSGWEAQRKNVTVSSTRGAIVKSAKAGSKRRITGGRVTIARVKLAQPAEVVVSVKRVGTISSRCVTGKRATVRWNGRFKSRKVRKGSYRVVLQVKSDRKTVTRRGKVRVG